MATRELELLQAQSCERVLHPCDVIQRSAFHKDNAERFHRVRTTLGWGAAADTALTETTLLSSRRLGALPSSSALYHHYRGTVSELTPLDLYGLPEDNPNVQPSSRAIVEKAFYGYELTMKNLGMKDCSFELSGRGEMFFCPFCGTLLLIEPHHPTNQFACSNCAYLAPIYSRQPLTVNHSMLKYNKIVEGSDDSDTAGAKAEKAEMNVGQLITVRCQNEEKDCDGEQAYYTQTQMRSADEPATTFFKCVKCGFQWRQD